MGELTSDIVAVAGLLSLSVNALLSSLHMLSHHSTCWMNRFHLMMIKKKCVRQMKAQTAVHIKKTA